jgi:quercetin dioxygenase-like cupin family protein
MMTPPESAGSVGYDPMAPNARRFPRVIRMAEIESVPRLEFSSGVEMALFLSRERDDALYFRQGYLWLEPDHAGYEWDQTNFDEAQYCLEGLIRLQVWDASGREIVLEAGPGEHIYLPGGYRYNFVPTGVRTVVFFNSGPSPRRGMSDRAYSRLLVAKRGD